jgi:hypothetical protein
MLAYCDYIAEVVRKGLVENTAAPTSLVKDVGSIEMDLHPTEGYFVSTKKTLKVIDINGKKYKVTVEEV